MSEKIKICPNCGIKFSCLHSCDCWCVKIRISKELSEYLRSRFTDCICEDCLRYFEQNEKNILSDR